MQKSCKITECNSKHYGKGYCSKHYQRVWAGKEVTNEREKMLETLPKNCIPLTRGKYALVDADMFEYLNQFKWSVSHYGYAVRCASKNPYITKTMHQEVMGRKMIDHVNHDTLDNRRENLRLCTKSQNLMNSKIRSDNTSGYKGVSFEAGKWRAYINKKGKRENLGRFNLKNDAAMAYNKAAKTLFGEFAFLNLIQS